MVISVLLIIRLYMVLMWTCSQVMMEQQLGSPVLGDSRCLWNTCNATKADLGRAFFHHLIHRNDSFHDVNARTMCFLMHFFVAEATYNSQPVSFSSGK